MYNAVDLDFVDAETGDRIVSIQVYSPWGYKLSVLVHIRKLLTRNPVDVLNLCRAVQNPPQFYD